MREYSKSCHFVYLSDDMETTYPCQRELNHEGPHLDGYGHEHPAKHWDEHVDYYNQYEELWERCVAAGRADLLEGLKP